jgi:hypothetical protein
MTENNDPKQGTPLDPDGPYADEQDVQFGQAAKNKEEELDQAIAEGRPLPEDTEAVRPGSKAEPRPDSPPKSSASPASQ